MEFPPRRVDVSRLRPRLRPASRLKAELQRRCTRPGRFLAAATLQRLPAVAAEISSGKARTGKFF